MNYQDMPFSSGIDSKDILFNKKKISNDVLSMSSASSSCSSISDTTSNSTVSYKERSKFIKDDDVESKKSVNESEYEDEDSEDEIDIKQTVNSYQNHESHKTVLNEKMELLYQMERLESKGYKLPFKFNLESNIHEMRSEYAKLIKEKETDASVRFQRKMLMAFVTGTEYLNTRYDPFSVRLDGWSEQVHDNILDYDDIFEELHVKYKSAGKKMSPELRLFISLSGSAFMFHLTSRMFKETPLPGVENVLKSNPDLMKQFQSAAAKQYMSGNTETESSKPGLFGMVSNLFSNLNSGPSQRQMYEEDTPQQSYQDIDKIINNVHNKISLNSDQNNIETLSVSDEEITSIIEDTADIKILKSGKNKRTLNL
jgi:hypothetical protein